MYFYSRINASDILNNQIEILECAKAFREDANNLMTELSKDYNFSLEPGELFAREVYAHKYNNKGIFRNEWIYYFHGAECRFSNINTGQIVEMIIIAKPEFGFLDSYFFYNYMATTERFKELTVWFENHTNVWNAIRILADENILTTRPSVGISRNIIPALVGKFAKSLPNFRAAIVGMQGRLSSQAHQQLW